MNILLADDHEVVRRGLKDILKEEFKQARFFEASSSTDVLKFLPERSWDLVLLDVVMPGRNIVEVIAEVHRAQPGAPILVLTAVAELEYALRTLKAGASGYITKQYAAEELLLAVRKVLMGETYLSGDAIKGLATSLRDDRPPELPHHKLSQRELEIFCLIARGRTVKEISGDLGVSDKTVGTHLFRIKEKTGLASYVEIARYALQHKLVD